MDKEKFYDTIADQFDSVMNMYDTNRRIEVIFDDFLGQEDLGGKLLLDGGCGTGWFTRRAVERGARVTSVDIAPRLVEITQQKNPAANAVVASILELPFPDHAFDIVISSDVIEHTPDPLKATRELIRVLKPGGKLCITAPNRSFWYFSVVLADMLKIRSYQGYENWVHYHSFKRFLLQSDIAIIQYKGIHLFPFVIPPLNPLLRRLDKMFDHRLGCCMVNLAAFGVKQH